MKTRALVVLAALFALDASGAAAKPSGPAMAQCPATAREALALVENLPPTPIEDGNTNYQAGGMTALGLKLETVNTQVFVGQLGRFRLDFKRTPYKTALKAFKKAYPQVKSCEMDGMCTLELGGREGALKQVRVQDLSYTSVLLCDYSLAGFN